MDKIKNIGLSLVTSIKNEIFDDKDEQNDRYIPEDVSPTTRKFMAKFDLQADEWVISNYSCALYNKILLQGHMYLTTKRLCFFSAFNNKNLIFSESTKLMIPYEEILAIEKKKTAVLFDNAIQITTIKEGEVKFWTLLKRDATYDLLYDLVFNYTQSFQNEFIIENNIPNIEEDQPYDARLNDQIEVDKADIIEVQPENYFQFEESKCRDFEEEKHADGIVHWHFDQKLINRLNNLAEVNRAHLHRFDEEFSDANFKEYNEIGSEIYPNIDIRTFFNMIYGDYLYENGQTFLSNYAEKSGSTAIIEQPREIPVPNYFADFCKIQTIFV